MSTAFKNSWVNAILRRNSYVCCVLLLVMITGCDHGPSFVSEVTGTVTIDGKPYPKVKVTFVPQINIEGNFIPTGVTDDAGKFTLSMLGDKPGCPAVQCKVTINEPSPPDEIQENLMGENPDDRMLGSYLRSLKLRPIPETYTRLKSTPFIVDVSSDDHDFEFELER